MSFESGKTEESFKVISQDGGKAVFSEHELFPGIRLIYQDIHENCCFFPYADMVGVLQIDHCLEGRYEHEIDGQYYYLSSDDVSVSITDLNDRAGFYPTGHYHGVTILLDPNRAPENLSCILEGVDVRPRDIIARYLSKTSCYIDRKSAAAEHIFSEIYTVKEGIRRGYLKLKVLELLLSMSESEVNGTDGGKRALAPAQVQLAKEALNYACGHLQEPLSVASLSNQFSVAPATLQRCMKNVYGQSVHDLIRDQRLQASARMLLDTDLSVTDIAGEVGYENASKFAAIFQRQFGVAPAKYRKLRPSGSVS